jgi:hypothetical protein
MVVVWFHPQAAAPSGAARAKTLHLIYTRFTPDLHLIYT